MHGKPKAAVTTRTHARRLHRRGPCNLLHELPVACRAEAHVVGKERGALDEAHPMHRIAAVEHGDP